MRKNQKGFSPVEGLLILIIVGLIGFIGWYVWHSTQNTDKTLDQSNKTSSSQIVANKSSPAQQQYLSIKEWSVKVPQLPKGNAVSYEISQYDKNSADFVSSEQKALGGECGSFGFARFHIFRAESGYKSTDDVFTNRLDEAAKTDLAIKIGSTTYYILGDKTGGDCTGTAKEGSSVSQQETTADEHLLNSLKGLTESD